jgi:predicted DNA-binding transcriptional regulator AlpA
MTRDILSPFEVTLRERREAEGRRLAAQAAAPSPVQARPEPSPMTGPDDRLIAAIDRLIEALDRRPDRAPVERLALRLEEVARAVGLSRRGIDRERAAGRFPKPDRVAGKVPLYAVETIRKWLLGPK